MEASSPWPRAPRKIKSCNECRRRKQKCNQGRPCSNCKRRFPEPVCDYGPQRSAPVISPRPIAFPVNLPATTPRSFQVGGQTRRLSPSSPGLLGRRSQGRTTGLVARWAGVDIETEYPTVDPDAPGGSDAAVWETLPAETSTPALLNSSTARRTPGRASPRLGGRRSPRLQQALAATQDLWHLAGPMHGMSALPIDLNERNALLIHTYSHVHYHFKGSFDGVPDPDNPFVKHLVPFCLQSPLLVYTSIYIAAQPLCERGYIDVQSTMLIKGNAIRLLNQYLRSDACTTDEVMGAVGAFIAIELYYGTSTDMRAHLMGLRGMVQLRGGFPNSSAGLLSTKVALVADAIIAISLEEPSILQSSDEFPYDVDEGVSPGRAHSSLKPNFNSPLMPPRVPFSSCTSALGLHPATTWILDEMAFLIDQVVSLEPDATEAEVDKVKASAVWIHDRITQLSPDSPDGPSPPAGSSGVASSESSQVSQESSPEAAVATAASDDDADRADIDFEARVIDYQARVVEEPGHPPKPHSLLPRYPELETASSPRAAASPPASPVPRGMKGMDSLYRAVRLSSLIYARSINTRRPLSETCTAADALAVFGACWRIPLAEWRRVIGIFVFVMLALVPTVYKTSADSSPLNVKVHTRFAKSILQIGWMQLSIESWPSCQDVIQRSLKLQKWLRDG